ncbi:MAG: arsenic metallochaperone ArsD family protein, partial [Bacillus sp. (in: Bacteria)]|nr:arsenic metallochaperone ArsD family protein [Bacillus sp. (in: firmicutes)]
YNLANDTDQFLNNSEVNRLLNEKGPGVLPVIIVDGKVTLTGQYPSNEEFETWTGIVASELSKKPIIHFSLNP